MTGSEPVTELLLRWMTAEALGVHPTTAKNDWRMAKLWLKRELSPKGAHAG